MTQSKVNKIDASILLIIAVLMVSLAVVSFINLNAVNNIFLEGTFQEYPDDSSTYLYQVLNNQFIQFAIIGGTATLLGIAAIYGFINRIKYIIK